MTGSPIKIFKNIIIKIILIVILCVSITAGESAVQANGGYITRNDFAVNSYTEHWVGFYGMITNNSMTIENFDMNNNAIPHIFPGISVHKGDCLIVTTSPSPPDLSGLKAGNIAIASIDEITGLGDDSGSNTFTNYSNYRIPSSGALLADVPSIYMFDGLGRYSRVALLEDINGDPVFAVQVEPRSGKNNETYYLQFMLPDNGRLKYYLFYLQSDI
ncbi:hypothetical protein METP3_01850 [Methanosarcinales archaeon]|nr:hypothetical protein METP3_01850 [Methanosarcinales archaeon]